MITEPLPILARHQQQSGQTIEQGHFVLTMMPSLYCDLDCPHCYLSKAERSDRSRLSNADLELILRSIDSYYDTRKVTKKTIHSYHYGGEPTSMGVQAFTEMLDTIDTTFSPQKGYAVNHTILTSLVDVDLEEWLPIFRGRCGNFLQSSYDGRMRGGAYVQKWDYKMREARRLGLQLSTISVVNSRLLQDGPEATIDYLSELGVVEVSFLPFMLNLQNEGKKFDRLAPTMNDWSDFLIGACTRWLHRKMAGLHAPQIGQLFYVLEQANQSDPASNIAGQTLFLLPNGDFALPDYDSLSREYMNRFKNGSRASFSEVLSSPKRRAYLRKQFLRNSNQDCQSCSHADKCVMEFWKDNRLGDDCFGGKRFVEWVMLHRDKINAIDSNLVRTASLY